MNKKAQYIKFMLLIVWAVFLVSILLVIVIFTGSLVKKEVDIRSPEARTFANRLLYSPHGGISYSDVDLGRMYPGTVDMQKLENAVLDSTVYIDDNQILAAKVTLKNIQGMEIKSAIYNEQWYLRWESLIGRVGSGGVSEIMEKRYVVIYDGDIIKNQGILEIQVLIPNA